MLSLTGRGRRGSSGSSCRVERPLSERALEVISGGRGSSAAASTLTTPPGRRGGLAAVEAGRPDERVVAIGGPGWT